MTHTCVNARRVLFFEGEVANRTKLCIPYRGVYLVAPVAYQVILEPGIGQFRESESPRVHTRINSWGLVLVHKSTCGKRKSAS